MICKACYGRNAVSGDNLCAICKRTWEEKEQFGRTVIVRKHKQNLTGFRGKEAKENTRVTKYGSEQG